MSAIRHSGKMLLRLGTAPAIAAMRLLIQTECRKSGPHVRLKACGPGCHPDRVTKGKQNGMARGRPRKQQPETGNTAVIQGATTGYEAELWAMADALRGSMDAAARSKDVLGRAYGYFL